MATNKALVHLAPESSPTAWIVVRCLLLLWSIAQLMDVLVSSADGRRAVTLSPTHQPLQRAAYWAWTLATTLVWCLDVGLTVWVRRGKVAMTWSHRCQWVIGLYLLWHALRLLLQSWRNPESKLQKELLVASVTTASYLWALIVALKWQLQRQQQHPPMSPVRITTPQRPTAAPSNQSSSSEAYEKAKKEAAATTAAAVSSSSASTPPSTPRRSEGGAFPSNSAATPSATPTSRTSTTTMPASSSPSKVTAPTTPSSSGQTAAASSSAAVASTPKATSTAAASAAATPGTPAQVQAMGTSAAPTPPKAPVVVPAHQEIQSRFPQFFKISEGREGWGHASMVNRSAKKKNS